MIGVALQMGSAKNVRIERASRADPPSRTSSYGPVVSLANMPSGGSDATERSLVKLVLAYGLFSLALLYPVVLHLTSDVATGDGIGDSYQSLWNLWWVKRSVLSGTSPLRTRMLMWPEETSLLFHTLSVANGVLSIPCQVVIGGTRGLIASLNLLVLATFTLTALAVHLLARHEGASESGAMAAGLLALTLPYRVWHVNHLNLLSIQWGIFTLLFLQRALQSGRALDVVGAAVAATFTTYSDQEIAVSTALAAVVLVASRLARLRTVREAALLFHRVGTCIGMALVLHLPLAWLLWRERSEWPLPPDLQEADSLSANLVGLVLPGPNSILHSTSLAAAFEGAPGLLGDEVFVGVAFFAALGFLCVRHRRELPWTWLGLGLQFLVLALGPSLHVGNHTFARGWMPYAWLRRYLPLLALGRSPVRMVEMGACCLAVAFAILLDPPSARARMGAEAPEKMRLTRLPACLLVLALLAERWPAYPVSVEPATVPAVYVDLAHDTESYAVMDLPVQTYFHRQVYMFWQTVHEKPITSGWVSRQAPGSGRWLDDLAATRAPDLRATMLERAGVRYVIEHPRDPDRLLTGDVRVISVPEWLENSAVLVPRLGEASEERLTEGPYARLPNR
jgi:hypothetical protein